MMDCFAKVTTEHRAQLDAERQQYVDLIRQRADAFLTEASKYALPLYPYSDGFFCMLRIEDEVLLNELHKALLARHIYTIKFSGGLRIALCSLNLTDCRKLPALISETLKEVRHG
jgi:aromatic-amino-acid transaminase